MIAKTGDQGIGRIALRYTLFAAALFGGGAACAVGTQSQGGSDAASPSLTIPATTTTRTDYGIVAWSLADIGNDEVVMTGQDAAGHVVDGFSLTASNLTTAGRRIVVEMLDGSHASMIGTMSLTEADQLSENQIQFLAHAVVDASAYDAGGGRSGVTGTMDVEPAPGAANGGFGTLDLSSRSDCTQAHKENDGTLVPGILMCAAALRGGGAGRLAETVAELAGKFGYSVPTCTDGLKASGRILLKCGNCDESGVRVTRPTCYSLNGTGGGGGSGTGGGEGGVENPDGGAGDGGYAFVRRAPPERHRRLELRSGSVTSIPFEWNESPSFAAADLQVEVQGRPLLQVASVDTRPFVRAGLDVVPIQAGRRYELQLERTPGSVRARLVDVGGEAPNVTVEAAAAVAGTVVDVVVSADGSRASIASDVPHHILYDGGA